jgi:hypothetical protein
VSESKWLPPLPAVCHCNRFNILLCQEQLSLLKVEQERVQLELRKWEDRRDEVEVQRLKSRRERTTGECKQTLRIANDTDVDVDADALPRARVHAPTAAEGIPPQQQHSHFRSAFE